jgi:hypothetical protein
MQSLLVGRPEDSDFEVLKTVMLYSSTPLSL